MAHVEVRCPVCAVGKGSKGWTYSQWQAKTAHRKNEYGKIIFTGCKDCHDKASRIRTATPEGWMFHDGHRRRGMRISSIGQEMEPRGLDGQTEMRKNMLTGLLREASHQNFDDFVVSWMQQLPESTRKSWAYMGSIFSREEVDPVEDFEMKTFCPGNWCYAIVLAMLCPRLLGRYGDVEPHGSEDWTVATRGTICKGILGANFLRLGAAPSEDTPAISALPHNLGEEVPTNAKYIEKIAYLVHRIVSETGKWDEFDLKEAWRRSRTVETLGDPWDTGDGAPQWDAREAPSSRRRRRGDDDPWGDSDTRWTGAAEKRIFTESLDEEPERREETLTLLVVGAEMLKRNPTLRNDPRIREKVRAVTRSLDGKCRWTKWLREAVAATSTEPYGEAYPRAGEPGERGDKETNWKTQGGGEWSVRSHWAGEGWEKARGAHSRTGYGRWSGNGWYGTSTGKEW